MTGHSGPAPDRSATAGPARPVVPPADHAAEALLASELAAARGELARVDARAGTLAGITGLGVAFLAAQIGHRPWPVQLLFGAAAVLLALACLVLLLGVLRTTETATGYGRYAALSIHLIAADLHARSGPYAQAGDLAILSRLVAVKNRRLRHATDLAAFAVLLILSGLLIAVVT